MNILIILLAIAGSAYLWRLGGDGEDLYRNPGVPILIGLCKFLITLNLWTLLFIPALWGMIQAFSYGVNAPPHKFWVWVFGQGKKGDYPPVEIATRCTCGFFWSLPGAIFAFFTGGWILFGVYVLFLTIANGLIWYYIKDVEVNEKAVGACVSVSMLI